MKIKKTIERKLDFDVTRMPDFDKIRRAEQVTRNLLTLELIRADWDKDVMQGMLTAAIAEAVFLADAIYGLEEGKFRVRDWVEYYSEEEMEWSKNE